MKSYKPISILIVSIALILMFCKFVIIHNNKNKIKEILSNSSFAIGKISYYQNGGKGTTTYVSYSFIDKNEKFENKYGNFFGFYVPSSGLYKGEQHLVIYSKQDPKNSIMLFDYPIRDSSDFKNYLNEFKTKPPKIKY